MRYAGRMLLGAHESVAGGAFTAIPRALEDGCETIQIFARPSAQWRSRPFAAGEVTRFRAERAQLSGPVLSHASYLINLCATDAEILEKSRTALEEELTRAEELGLEYVVLHPGAHLGAGERDGIASAAESLAAVHERTRGMRVRLLLEVTAGQGSCLGCRFEQIEAMLSRARSGGDVGVCFDTCHVHASGYDLSTDEGYDRTFAELDRVLGIDRIKACSTPQRLEESPAGSRGRPPRRDNGDGFLGKLPFWRLVNDPRFARIPGVLETPSGPDKQPSFKRNLERLRAPEVGAAEIRRSRRLNRKFPTREREEEERPPAKVCSRGSDPIPSPSAGEGQGERVRRSKPISCCLSRPLTLTLSPADGGEGTGKIRTELEPRNQSPWRHFEGSRRFRSCIASPPAPPLASAATAAAIAASSAVGIVGVGRHQLRHVALDETGVVLAGGESRVAHDLAMKAEVRLDPAHVILAERAPHAIDRRRPRVRPGAQLGDHRIVVDRDHAARDHARIVADTGTAGHAQRGDGPRRRQKAHRVLGIDAAPRSPRPFRAICACVIGNGSPCATASCQRTRSTPVTSSVTGCSTCKRVFISRK